MLADLVLISVTRSVGFDTTCNSSLELILKNNERKWKIEETKEEKKEHQEIVLIQPHSRGPIS